MPTRSVNFGLQKGAFHLAVEGQYDIIPVVCENYNQLYSSKQKRFRSGTITLKGAPEDGHVSSTCLTLTHFWQPFLRSLQLAAPLPQKTSQLCLPRREMP